MSCGSVTSCCTNTYQAVISLSEIFSCHLIDDICRGQRGEGGVSFRGDGRWLGLARDPRRDLLACLTASSSLIFADFSFPDCA